MDGQESPSEQTFLNLYQAHNTHAQVLDGEGDIAWPPSPHLLRPVPLMSEVRIVHAPKTPIFG